MTSQVAGDGVLYPSNAQMMHSEVTVFSLQPDVLQKIKTVTGCSGVLQDGQYTVTHPTEDCQIVVEFEPIAEEVLSQTEMKTATFSLPITPRDIATLDATIDSFDELDLPDKFVFDGISFENIDDVWYIINQTPVPIETLAVRVVGNNTLTRLSLSETVPEYSKAAISFSTSSVESIAFEHQFKLFNPTITIGPNNVADKCTDETKICYSAPNLQQRDIIEKTVINIYNLVNTKGYSELKKQFFGKYCGNYSKCAAYTDVDLPYDEFNLLKFGAEGHNLFPRIIRNVRKALGMGGGSKANLSHFRSSSGGWASIWEDFINHEHPKYGKFKPHAYMIWYHEIGHAMGMSHSTGMTYGWADRFSKFYLPLAIDNETRESRGKIHTPPILIDHAIINQNSIKLSFVNTSQLDISQVNLHVLTACKWNYDLAYYPSPDNPNVTIRYTEPPHCPLFLRATVDDADRVATIKISRNTLVESNSYHIDGKIYQILNDSLLKPYESAWGVRKICEIPGSRLAKKEEYKLLWQYIITIISYLIH
ncbi:hypothetical protein [Veronia pacifica]|uniref:hypothetical protein n=1 Tax=Veronia pacifica TaxID=1080227 RepID=UPI001586DB7A|nr:hypothetical protein [Veronia pacifica]